MIRKIIFTIALLFLFSTSSWAEEKILNARLGVGTTFGPTSFLLVGNIEAQVDEFFSFGPMLQLGMGSTDDYVIPTLGGRFIVPAAFTKTENFRGIEFSLHAGMGMLHRDSGGFQFRGFDYVAGLNADMYVSNSVSVGLGTLINITDSNVQSSISALYASAAFHY